MKFYWDFKKIAQVVLRTAGFALLPFSSRFLSRFFSLSARAVSSARTPQQSLEFLFNLERQLYTLVSEEAARYEGGLHPKHRITAYHDFFVNHVIENEKVLDIGCGNGALAFDLAEKSRAFVTAIEISKSNYNDALKLHPHERIKYVHGDALKDLPEECFDTVVISNVLEHLPERSDFLKRVQQRINPSRWLVRVPMYQRDWRVALMDELGIDYRLDNTHYIEYTKKAFFDELFQAGLLIKEIETVWGEFWCEAVPVKNPLNV